MARTPDPERTPGTRAASAPHGDGDTGRLLLVCALLVERAALRSAVRRLRPLAPPLVLRTGMGPAAARASLAAALSEEPVAGGTAVLATGFCAGLVPGMRPGDLVVAEETSQAGVRTRCHRPDLLAEALRSRRSDVGAVHTGQLAGSERIVRGDGRAELRAGGAVAVDMESAAVLEAASRQGAAARAFADPAGRSAAAGAEAAANGPRPRPPREEWRGGAGRRPVAAVRVVVDAPGHELFTIGTLRGGISAFRALRAVLPAFLEWHRSLLLPRR